MSENLRGRAAIVGVAESDLGEVGPDVTPLDLVGQATLAALRDAGLKKEDVDGLFSASSYYYMPTLSVGEYLGIRPRYTDSTTIGGSSFVSHLHHAAAAIDQGSARSPSSPTAARSARAEGAWLPPPSQTPMRLLTSRAIR